MNAPVPDPTVLTTEALHREFSALSDLFSAKLEGVVKLLDAKIDDTNRLKEEKFRGVHAEFAQIEQKRIEQKADAKERIDAALTAQKDAATKSEQSFTKQIDSMGELMGSNYRALNEKVDTIVLQVTKKEGSGQGMSQMWGFIIGAAGVIAAIIAIIVK